MFNYNLPCPEAILCTDILRNFKHVSNASSFWSQIPLFLGPKGLGANSELLGPGRSFTSVKFVYYQCCCSI